MSNLNAKRINARQRERLLDLVERNKNLLFGLRQGSDGKIQTWRHITSVLNKLGSEKTVDQWKKTWSDIKSAVKKKAVELKALNTTYGSDFPIEMQLSEEDYQVLRMCDSYILDGISEIAGDLSYLHKVNSAQRERLLELVQENSKILCGSDTEERLEVWSRVAVSLNVLGHKKTSEQWRRVWLHLKQTVKKKLASLKSACTSKQLKEFDLTQEDLKVISIYETEVIDISDETDDFLSESIDENMTIDSESSVPSLSRGSRASTKMESFKWESHGKSITDFQKTLKNEFQTCDITLAFKGKSVKVHRFILSACSNLVCDLLRDVPIGMDATIIVPDIDGSLLDGLLNFLYMGETNVGAPKLTEFLEALSNLGIKSPISFDCANISAASKEPITDVVVDLIELEDYVKQEVVIDKDTVVENSSESQVLQNESIANDQIEIIAVDEFHIKDITSLTTSQFGEVNVLDENMDVDNPYLKFGEDPIGEDEYNPKRPRIKTKSSDDAVQDNSNEPQTFRDKVDRLRAERKKSLKAARCAHLQNRMSVQKAATTFEVSRTDLVRRADIHQLEKGHVSPQPEPKQSSDENDEEVTRTDLLRIRKNIKTRSNPLDLSDRKFTKFFKMSKQTFIYLLNEVKDKLPESTRSTSIPPILKLAATLRFLVEGGLQKKMDNEFKLGLSQPKLSQVFTEMLLIIENHMCPQWITFEYTEEEKQQSKLFFYHQAGIPGVIGCVDGTHIRILSPSQDQQKYCNRMGYHSLNAMIVCDHRMNIRFVDGRNPGSVHESVVWKSSELRKVLQKRLGSADKNTWLLGDDAFPLEPFLITPFRSAVKDSKEDTFNKKHSISKEIIERTIGLLKNRFQCLLGERPLHYSPQKVTQIINVCAALHNICLHFKSNLPVDKTIVDLGIAPEERNADEPAVAIEDDKKAEKIRNQVLNAILTI